MTGRKKPPPAQAPYWDPGTARPAPEGREQVLGAKPEGEGAPVLWPAAPQSDAEAEAEAAFDNMPF